MVAPACVIAKARLDPALAIRIVGRRALRYTTPGEHDRPHHVRAASGLAHLGGRLAIVQDDVAFIAVATEREVAAIALPAGPGGRRRFEARLGNKLDKLDLEACVAVGDQLWAFGSGSTAARERVVIVAGDAARVIDGRALYAPLRDAVGGPLNLEGAARVGDELWLFHRGNTGPSDRGPAAARFELAAVARWLDDGPPPHVVTLRRFDLGAIDGVALGFTDAVGANGRVYYLAAAEASPNAIDDGRVLGSQLGVIDDHGVRAAVLADGGHALKAEGLAFDPRDPRRAWIAIDPDDVDRAAQLYEVELVGPW